MSEDEGVDVKEIDMLLSELGIMLGRWSLYCRFIARKCLVYTPPPLHQNYMNLTTFPA